MVHENVASRDISEPLSQAGFRQISCPSLYSIYLYINASQNYNTIPKPVTRYRILTCSKCINIILGPKLFHVFSKRDIYGSDFKGLILWHMLKVKFMSTYCEIALRWMSWAIVRNESASVQKSDFPSQFSTRSKTPYVVNRPQWITFYSIMHSDDQNGFSLLAWAVGCFCFCWSAHDETVHTVWTPYLWHFLRTFFYHFSFLM